jgi:hypothetical protein
MERVAEGNTGTAYEKFYKKLQIGDTLSSEQ